MTLVVMLRQLQRRRLRVALGVLVAAVLTVGISQASPPKSEWQATSQMVVDSATSAIGDGSQPLLPLAPRAGVYANMMTTTAVLNLIGQAAGIPGNQISATGPIDTITGQFTSRGAIVASPQDYSLQYTVPSETQPLVVVTAQAVSASKAAALASAAPTGLSHYLTNIAASQDVQLNHRIDIRSLGTPSMSEVTSGISKTYLPIIFLVVLLVWCLGIIVSIRFAAAWRRSAALLDQEEAAVADQAALQRAYRLGPDPSASEAIAPAAPAAAGPAPTGPAAPAPTPPPVPSPAASSPMIIEFDASDAFAGLAPMAPGTEPASPPSSDPAPDATDHEGPATAQHARGGHAPEQTGTNGRKRGDKRGLLRRMSELTPSSR